MGHGAHLWHRAVLPYLAAPVKAILLRAAPRLLDRMVEIRLRAGGPLQVIFVDGEGFLDHRGRETADPRRAYAVSPRLVEDCWQILSRGSAYAWEEETRQGFLTLPGGHRVGLSGRYHADGGRIVRLRSVGGLAIRLGKAVPGAADAIVSALWEPRRRRLHHCLIYSPPGAGKTTMLRDLIRQVSSGVPGLGMPGHRVAVVDERSELAACVGGAAQFDLGFRTDVLDGCPKAEGMVMALRSLNPQVIAFDEIGGPHEADVVIEAVHAGVAVFTTAHASSLAELRRRPALRRLLDEDVFQRKVRLEIRGAPGFVAEIHQGPAAPWGVAPAPSEVAPVRSEVAPVQFGRPAVPSRMRAVRSEVPAPSPVPDLSGTPAPSGTPVPPGVPAPPGVPITGRYGF